MQINLVFLTHGETFFVHELDPKDSKAIVRKMDDAFRTRDLVHFDGLGIRMEEVIAYSLVNCTYETKSL